MHTNETLQKFNFRKPRTYSLLTYLGDKKIEHGNYKFEKIHRDCGEIEK